MSENPDGFTDVGDLSVKLKKNGYRVHAKRDFATARFDPFAPSTSAVMS